MTPNGTTSPKPLAGPAGYTLPGVIGYLTSEFTNLERYKIVNNIEKSEMKFKIQKLVSEVNSLKFINNRQALRIKELEAQLLAQKNSLSLASKAGPDAILSPDRFPASIKAPIATLDEIPPIDLQVLRDSRLKLNRAIKDALDLLKPPTTGEILQECSISGQSDFEKLLDESNSNQFFESMKESQPQKDNLFSFYTLNNNDVLSYSNSKSETFHDSIPPPEQDRSTDPAREQIKDTKPINVVPGEESETETVIVDEPDVARLLISEDEGVEKEKSPQILADSFGEK